MLQNADPAVDERPARAAERPGWFREFVVAVGVGVLLLGGQAVFDDRRSDREEDRENLRFVRDRSGQRSAFLPFANLDLQGMTLIGYNLNGANFDHAELQNARFDGALLHAAAFGSARIGSTDFTGAKMAGADFSCDCDGLVLARPIFVEATLTSATFTNRVIREGNFQEADLREAELQNVTVENSDFARADLRGANLQGAKNLASADLAGACHDDATDWPTDYRPAPSADPSECGPSAD